MNFFFISTEYPPQTHLGGIGTYVETMARALAQRGHTVTVYSLSKNPSAEEIVQDGVRVKRLPIFHGFHPFWTTTLSTIFKPEHATYWVLATIAWSFTVYLAIHKAVRNNEIPIVEYPDYLGQGFFLSLLRSRRCRTIVRLHTTSEITDKINHRKAGFWKRLIYQMEHYAITHADLISAPSRSIVELTTKIVSFSERSLCIYPYPIDTTLFKAGERRSNGGHKTVLFTGRLEPRKGVLELAKAIPQVVQLRKDVRFLLVGSDTPSAPAGGSMRTYLKVLLKDYLMENVEFLERKPRPELVPYYQSCTLAVFPSLYDNFPYTCLEAMACGVAVIGSNSGGTAEMIEHGVSGWLVDVKKEGELCKAILQLLDNDPLRAELGQGAVQRINLIYHADRVTQEAMKAYVTLLQTPKR